MKNLIIYKTIADLADLITASLTLLLSCFGVELINTLIISPTCANHCLMNGTNLLGVARVL